MWNVVFALACDAMSFSVATGTLRQRAAGVESAGGGADVPAAGAGAAALVAADASRPPPPAPSPPHAPAPRAERPMMAASAHRAPGRDVKRSRTTPPTGLDALDATGRARTREGSIPHPRREVLARLSAASRS